jgi:hypothetical protein
MEMIDHLCCVAPIDGRLILYGAPITREMYARASQSRWNIFQRLVISCNSEMRARIIAQRGKIGGRESRMCINHETNDVFVMFRVCTGKAPVIASPLLRREYATTAGLVH